MPEFGPSRESAIKQITEWLGGAVKAPNNYARIVKNGVGATILNRFTGLPDTTIKAALTLAEKFLRSTKNVGEFNNLLKTSNRSRGDDAFFWQAEYYARAKNAIGEQGDGLGKDVVKHFLPKHAIPGSDTLQNAIDSHYAERWQAAAESRVCYHARTGAPKKVLDVQNHEALPPTGAPFCHSVRQRTHSGLPHAHGSAFSKFPILGTTDRPSPRARERPTREHLLEPGDVCYHARTGAPLEEWDFPHSSA